MMNLQKTLPGFLVLLLTAACRVPQAADRPVIWTNPESLATRKDVVEAADTLRQALVTRKVYPQVEPECLAFELAGTKDGAYEFAAKVNQLRCGGDSASNLLDRYRVVLRTRAVMLYDPTPEDGVWYKPLTAYHPCDETRGGRHHRARQALESDLSRPPNRTTMPHSAGVGEGRERDTR